MYDYLKDSGFAADAGSHLDELIKTLIESDERQRENLNDLGGKVPDVDLVKQLRLSAITAKNEFNQILDKAAEVGRMTAEKMTLVEDAAQTASDVADTVENVTTKNE